MDPGPSQTLKTSVSQLTVPEIKRALPPFVFSSAEKRSRPKIVEAVYQLPPEQRALVEDAAMRKRRKIETIPDIDQQHPLSVTDHSDFFETVTEECRQDRISKFIDATGRKALTISVCAVCAGSFFLKELQNMKVSELRSKKILLPSRPHPAQNLTDGMLLHRTTTSLYADDKGIENANVCASCMSAIKQKKRPALSLANGMWIGDIPMELSILTFPERILIARHFPAAYIIKLHPRKKGSQNWSNASFHSGLQGNVSTYRLNTDDIAQMTSGNIMPPPPAILAATIGVTFVGPNNLPQKTMPPFLRVNRTRVHDALCWLKANNPIYRDITISTERLHALPENDVPDEILSLAKYSNNTALLAEENDGYVPTDVPFDVGAYE